MKEDMGNLYKNLAKIRKIKGGLERKVFILSTEGESSIILNPDDNNLYKYSPGNPINPISIKQHLYVISDNSDVEEGDWYLFSYSDDQGIIHKSISRYTKSSKMSSDGGKVIATSDISLGNHILTITMGGTKFIQLPQLPESFILKYIESYNSGKPIFDILVEYDVYDNQCDGMSCAICDCSTTTEEIEYKLKINSKDNTITIG